MEEAMSERARRGIRWWPVVLVVLAAVGYVGWTRQQEVLPFQERNIRSVMAGLVALILLLLWWVGFSRARWLARVAVVIGLLAGLGLVAGLFRIRGVSGDLLPILEPRWRSASGVPGVRAPGPDRVQGTNEVSAGRGRGRVDFPQFLGPGRDCRLTGLRLERDWSARPPRVIWRQPIGAAWSGFVVVGARAVTQEQRGEEELVTAYELETGRRLWEHADGARYFTTIAGEGPRATPTVVSNRVYALGATGILNCLELETGKRVWSRNIAKDAGSSVPGWGFAGSPLVYDGWVVVSAGGADNKSLIAYRVEDGEVAWSAGSRPANYSSPFLATVAGVRQVLMFNSQAITAHAAGSGAVLWEHPWGIGQPHVAVPVVVSSNQLVFSSGYGVGAELLTVERGAGDGWSVRREWKSMRLKAKFANFVAREGYLYGLDDGIMACVAVSDGSQRWKEGRYGHGQMLLVEGLLLVTAENGEVVLLAPTPEGPNELGRMRVLESKTWNPPALSGNLLLVRNDLEAACVELPDQR